MRIAYLVMTHENPSLLQRMIQTLSFGDGECGFFIHLDQKTPYEAFASVHGQNVCFCEKRIPVYWGEFSQVEAILALIRLALDSPNRYDYCFLITGSCYPLRTGGYIRKFIETNQGAEYMELVKVPGRGYPLTRFATIRYPRNKPILRFIYRFLAKIGLAQRDVRKHLGGLEPYSGEGAWVLSREACQYVLNFVGANPHVGKYFRCTFAPDEAFFHTILGNSQFRERMLPNLVYALWPNSANGHPAQISLEDVAMFEAQDGFEDPSKQELLFARKFNDRHLDVVRLVEAMIERKERIRLSLSDQSVERCTGPLERQPCEGSFDCAV
jgi:hypothetical protein